MAEEPIRVETSSSFPVLDEGSRIQALQAGSEEAFNWLIGHYASSVFRLAYRILNDHADAADAVQEVFLKVFRSI